MIRTKLARFLMHAVLLTGVSLIAWACSSDGEAATQTPTTLDDVVAAEPPTTAEAAKVEIEVEVEEASFPALTDMTPVRGFFVDNLVGDLDATVAVAEQIDGGVYPVGSLIQLIPGEAMVKREAGFSPATNDWEFFELDVTEAGATIRVRGGAQVVNRFGLSCADCHLQADPQFDLVCEQNHGCDPLPFDRETIEAIQSSDPRPLRTP